MASKVPPQYARKKQPAGSKKVGPRRNYKPYGPTTNLAPHIDAIAAETRAYREEHKRHEHGRKFREWATVLLLVCTTTGVFWQIYEMVKVYEPIKESASATRDAADVSRDALIMSRRAWVGPHSAKITEPKIGEPLEVTVTYQNVGQEPALNFIYEVDAFASTRGKEANQATLRRTTQFLTRCQRRRPFPGQAVYPSTGFSRYKLFSKPKIDVDQAILDGEKTIFVQGCFTYITIKETHHSFFCYFYRAGFTKPESMNICTLGHYAD